MAGEEGALVDELSGKVVDDSSTVGVGDGDSSFSGDPSVLEAPVASVNEGESLLEDWTASLG